MGLITNICFTILVLIISIFGTIMYFLREFDSTAKLVSVARYCALGLNPNYTIHDEYNIGIDKYAHHFHNEESLKSACNIYNYILKDFINTLAQRTYYFDKQIINILNSSPEYKQLVLLGAGKEII